MERDREREGWRGIEREGGRGIEREGGRGGEEIDIDREAESR